MKNYKKICTLIILIGLILLSSCQSLGQNTFDCIKNNAINNIIKNTNFEEYDADEKQEIINLESKYSTLISQAGTIEDINDYVKHAHAELDLVKTSSQVLDFSLSNIKLNTIKNLYNYKNLQNYSQDDKTTIINLLETAKININNEQTSDAISDIASDTKATIDSIQTITRPTSNDWTGFRADNFNNGLTSQKTPQELSNLLWQLQIDVSWEQALSAQILVQGFMYAMAGDILYKIDSHLGNITSQVKMKSKINWGNIPPTFADGKIYVALDKGVIQCFDADTLESLWYYSDELKGQSLTPIKYDDGFIYTGFWNGETNEANYVCLDTNHLDLISDKKDAIWTYASKGGYYGAGCVVVGDYLLVGCDDGEEGATSFGSFLTIFDKKLGQIINKYPIIGDQRATILYDEISQKIFFTTKNGIIYSGDFDKHQGIVHNLDSQKLLGSESTCTPTIFKNRLYLTSGKFGGGGYIEVFDAMTLNLIYFVYENYYPQSSILLTDNYYDKTQKVYVYYTCNGLPGGIRYFEDDKTSNSATPKDLFIPMHEQYCISNIIVGENGVLYYKNDSGYIFAISNNDEENDKTISCNLHNEIKCNKKIYNNKNIFVQNCSNSLSQTNDIRDIDEQTKKIIIDIPIKSKINLQNYDLIDYLYKKMILLNLDDTEYNFYWEKIEALHSTLQQRKIFIMDLDNDIASISASIEKYSFTQKQQLTKIKKDYDNLSSFDKTYLKNLETLNLVTLELKKQELKIIIEIAIGIGLVALTATILAGVFKKKKLKKLKFMQESDQ